MPSLLLAIIFSKKNFFLTDILFQRDMSLQSTVIYTHDCLCETTYILFADFNACMLWWQFSLGSVVCVSELNGQFYFNRLYAACIDIVRKYEK